MSRPAFLPRFSRHMAERQGRVEQGAKDKRARDFEFAPKLRLRRTVHFETTVHSRDGCQGKYGTVPDFRRAARRFVRNARRSVRRQVTNSLPCSLAMIVTILLA